MELYHLKTFTIVAEEGHLTRANDPVIRALCQELMSTRAIATDQNQMKAG